MEAVGKNKEAVQSFKAKVWRDGRFTESEFHIKKGKIVSGLKTRPYKAAYIIPPYTEPHIHGGWGKDFKKSDFGPLEKTLKRLGIFCAVPAISCSSVDRLKKISASFKKYKEKNPDSMFPFLRVEGPFISRGKKGAQDEKYILPPTIRNFKELLSIDSYKIHTFAPEITHSDVFVTKALKAGKIPSAGHSQAAYRDFIRLYDLGLRHMTHFPNAMSPLHHREIGLTGAGLLLDGLQLEFIADGIHNSIDFFALLLKIKGPSFCLTSDMVPQAFSGSRSFPHVKADPTGRRITIENDVLAGGATPVPEQAAMLFKYGIKPEEIIPLTCTNALKFLGLPVTEIKQGQDADFILLNKSFEVEAVYEKGKRL